MATAAEELDDKDGQNDIDKPVEGADHGAVDEGGESDDDLYAPLAQEMGWVPKDQFQGPEDAWKPARQFIVDGRDIQRETARELKALRSTVDTMAKTSSSIVEQAVARRAEELRQKYEKAVDDGDATEAFKLGRELDKTLNTTSPAGPPAEAQMFAERNAGWFQKDPLATSVAIEVTNRLAAQGYDAKTQLEAAEKEVRRLYPHLFKQTKPAAGVAAPSGRAPSQSRGPKGFADMPAEAQKVANDMVERGVIPDKESYAKNYWANAERKA